MINISDSRRRRPTARRYLSRTTTSNVPCPNGIVYATCLMKGGIGNDIGNEIEGRIDFAQQVNSNCVPIGNLKVFVQVMGLESGDGVIDHGLHVHKYGDLRDQCLATGPHYNPFEQNHGGRFGSPRHFGDLGFVREDGNGNIRTEFRVPQTSIVGPRSIIGRAVVLHALKDDLGLGNNEGSRQTGNSGSRLACCVIGRAGSVRRSRNK